MISNDELTSVVDNIFNPQLCPRTNQLFLGHKYLLPNYRAKDYTNQDHLNRISLTTLILCTLPEATEYFDDVTKGAVCNVMLATRHNRPTLFLERELGEVLAKSKLPPDLTTNDIKFSWPSVRVILPKNLVTIRHNDFTASIMYLDIGYVDANVDIKCTSEIAVELDRNAAHYISPEYPRLKMCDLTFQYDLPALFINGYLDRGESKFTPTAYGITKPWMPHERLVTVKEMRGDLKTNFPLDGADAALLRNVENLTLNILILLSAVPLEYEPAHIERKAKFVGKRLIPALLKPKWVGDHLLRAKRAGTVKGELTGQHKAAHWVSPHWKRQPHGKGFALRKLIWILPYHTGEIE